MKEIVEYYDKIAEKYDSDRFDNSYGEFIHQQEKQILNILLSNEKGTVLDLACGSGRLLEYANFGLDASSEMIKIAKQKFQNKEIYLSDAEKIPFEENSIDTIICFHFFMHLNQEKVHAILQECHRVLKNNGRIIFDIPSKKRRDFINFKTNNWHGAYSISIKDLQNEQSEYFMIRKKIGLLFLPIHRIPKGIRKYFAKIDFFIAQTFLKEFSSYLVIELIKK